MKYFIWLVLLLTACQSKEKGNPIVGKWEYVTIERYSGEPIDLQDSLINSLNNAQKGLTFLFTKDHVFKVTQKRENNIEEFVAEQEYQLPDSNKTLRLKNKTKADDNFSIVELSDTLLKINLFNNKDAYLVFRKTK